LPAGRHGRHGRRTGTGYIPLKKEYPHFEQKSSNKGAEFQDASYSNQKFQKLVKRSALILP